MVPYLLNILEGRLDILENPATTKAQIVKALKSMTRSFTLGEKVSAILEKSSIWSEYKDQKHDLFISNSSMTGYLTGKIETNIRNINLIENLYYQLIKILKFLHIQPGHLFRQVI